MRVTDNKTGLIFEFSTHKEKEEFFNLWDKYEIKTICKKCGFEFIDHRDLNTHEHLCLDDKEELN